MAGPVVTIGIPTYGRAGLLERALRSALAQDYPAVRVLVSDDASPDDGATERAVRTLAASNPAVRYLRQPRNLGFTGNYNATLAAAETDLFMWLADDDWLAPDYVSRCVAALQSRPDAVAAGGCARLIAPDGSGRGEDCVRSCAQAEPASRVLAYAAQVGYNSALFAVMRRGAARVHPKPEVLGGDWLFVARLLFDGALIMCPEALIYRSVSGLSAETAQLVRAMKLPRWQAWIPHVTIAANFAAAAFAEARRRQLRGPLRLGWLSFWLVFFRHSWGRRFWRGRYRRAWVAGYVEGGNA